MPSLSMLQFALLAVIVLVAAILGWLSRGRRCSREKQAISAGWQHQIDAQQKEHDRIAAQNTSLMEQVSRLQADGTEARQRAGKFAKELRLALQGRDDLQRKARDLRRRVDTAVRQRDKLQNTATDREAQLAATDSASEEKDDKIARLKRELSRWQERVPPLVERYRQRDLEAQQLEIELAQAREQQSADQAGDTRIETMQRRPINSLDASNDQYDETLETETLEPAHREPPGHRDDLKRIKGIGPAIEKTLNELGIVSFRQLADLTDIEIDRIAQQLRGAKTRIHREDWIGQARLFQHDTPRFPA